MIGKHIQLFCDIKIKTLKNGIEVLFELYFVYDFKK